MTKRTRSTSIFFVHTRIIMGGIIVAFSLTLTSGVVVGLFHWEFSRLFGAIFGFIAVTIGAFVMAKWRNGNFVDGLAIGFLFAWFSVILFRQTIPVKLASPTILGVLILLVVAPLPLGVSGLTGGLLGQLSRKRRGTRTPYTVRCPACGYHNAPGLKNCGRCGQALQ